MHALFTAIILWVEATLAAIFFFATLVGSLEESLFSLLSIIAALGVLSLVAAWKLPPALTYKIGVQTALVEGCVLFAFPFVWLLSTSMKYDEEIFVYPPQWIPALPANVEASPYASVESVGTLERPDGVSDSRWNDLVQRAEPALWSSRTFSGQRGKSDLAARTAEPRPLCRRRARATTRPVAAGWRCACCGPRQTR